MFLGSSCIQSVLGEIPPDITIICIPQHIDKVTSEAFVIVDDICNLNQIEMAISKGGTIVTVEEAKEEIARKSVPLFDFSFNSAPGVDATDATNVKTVTETIINDRLNLGLQKQKTNPIVEDISTLKPTGMRGTIIASESTKGGVGKSTTGINVAAFYAGQHKSTCLIDLDIGKGNAAAMLRLKGRTGPTVENWSSYDRLGSIRHSSGFYLIPWGNNPGMAVNELEIANLIKKASEEFEIVVLDYGVNPYLAMVGLEMADKIYLIANQSESMLVEFMETFIKAFPHLVDKSELVINRVTPSGYYKPSEVAHKTGFTTFHVIPECVESNKVSEKTGKAFVQIPGSKAGEAFIRMLGGEIKEKKKPLFGFLRR